MNNSIALNNLGIVYEIGLTVEGIDLIKAEHYYRRVNYFFI